MNSSKTTNILLAIIAASLIALIIIIVVQSICKDDITIEFAPSGQTDAVIYRMILEGWRLSEKGGEQPGGGRFITFRRCK